MCVTVSKALEVDDFIFRYSKCILIGFLNLSVEYLMGGVSNCKVRLVVICNLVKVSGYFSILNSNL